MSVADTNSYSKPKLSRNACSRALLCAPKLSWVPNGSGTRVSGLPRCSRSIAPFGTLSGTLRKPSMSSLNATMRDGLPVRVVKACRTQLVRATSPKVPICGRPDGP